MLPEFNNAVEIGVGSGKFAVPLGIKFGIEPSEKMRKASQRRGIEAKDGDAENLPIAPNSLEIGTLLQ